MINISKYCSIIDRSSILYKNECLNKYNICGCHVPYFFFLYNNDGATQEEVSKGLLVNKSTVTRSLQVLESNGFITRKNDECDKRTNHIFLTEQGKELVPIIRKEIEKFNNLVCAGLSLEEIDKLSILLDLLSNNAKELGRKVW